MTAKADVLDALDQAREILSSGEPLTARRVRVLLLTLDCAAASTEAIQENKRPRRKEKQ